MTVVIYFSKHSPQMLKKRTNPKFTEKWDKIVIAFISIGFVPIFFTPGIEYRFGLIIILPLVELIGFIVMSLGFIIIFLTMKENAFLSKAVEIQEGHEVITTGPYGIVRHPMYMGFILYMFGYCIALGSLFSLIFAVIGIVGLIARTVLEDKMLHEELRGYTENAQKTRKKLIPGIW
ncbi:MAG: methyltransferase family protein [Promethearchaeota archaeon]